MIYFLFLINFVHQGLSSDNRKITLLNLLFKNTPNFVDSLNNWKIDSEILNDEVFKKKIQLLKFNLRKLMSKYKLKNVSKNENEYLKNVYLAFEINLESSNSKEVKRIIYISTILLPVLRASISEYDKLIQNASIIHKTKNGLSEETTDDSGFVRAIQTSNIFEQQLHLEKIVDYKNRKKNLQNQLKLLYKEIQNNNYITSIGKEKILKNKELLKISSFIQ